MVKLYAPKNADIEEYFAANFNVGDSVVRVSSEDPKFIDELKGKIQKVMKLSGSLPADQVALSEPYQYIAATIGLSTLPMNELGSIDDGKKLIAIAVKVGDKRTFDALKDKMYFAELVNKSATYESPEKTGADLAASRNIP